MQPERFIEDANAAILGLTALVVALNALIDALDGLSDRIGRRRPPES
jgi:hypothetical protein